MAMVESDTQIIIKYISWGENMKIESLDIEGIGGIKKLYLNFSDGFNVICGANGIGKTTILNIIADIFSGGHTKLKRNSQYNEGQYIAKYYDEKEIHEVQRKIKDFTPNETTNLVSSEYAKYLLRFDVNRNYEYIALSALMPDPVRDRYDNGREVEKGIQAQDIKNWFINRFAFSEKIGSLTPEEIDNYNIAKKIFGVLDETVRFKTVLAKSFDIILSTQGGDIYFEYLSAGYKSCIYIIMGIIKEIEYRFGKTPIKISDFDGCILIDEIEEHLHPAWQARLVKTLKQIFPKCQFIVSTHSPSILQSVEENEIIPLHFNEKHETSIKELKLGKYGLQGWSLDEILKDVMDIPSTTSDLYQEVIDAFDRAMEDENITEIKRNFAILDEMLHPKSILRRLLRIQMAGMEE